MIKRIVPILSVLVSLALPTSAIARSRHGEIPDTNPITLAAHRALLYWHLIPCEGNVKILSEPLASDLKPDTQMWTTYATTAQPYEAFTECVIHINKTAWPTWEADDNDFPQFCQIMVHEFGHLEGYGDIGAKYGTVEYEEPTTAPIVPQCLHYRLRLGKEWITEVAAVGRVL